MKLLGLLTAGLQLSRMLVDILRDWETIEGSNNDLISCDPKIHLLKHNPQCDGVRRWEYSGGN